MQISHHSREGPLNIFVTLLCYGKFSFGIYKQQFDDHRLDVDCR